jgi:hypothetical protein
MKFSFMQLQTSFRLGQTDLHVEGLSSSRGIVHPLRMGESPCRVRIQHRDIQHGEEVAQWPLAGATLRREQSHHLIDGVHST